MQEGTIGSTKQYPSATPEESGSELVDYHLFLSCLLTGTVPERQRQWEAVLGLTLNCDVQLHSGILGLFCSRGERKTCTALHAHTLLRGDPCNTRQSSSGWAVLQTGPKSQFRDSGKGDAIQMMDET